MQAVFLGAAWAAAATKPQPNVILITIDTVRADHLGCYGYKEIRTPNIDGLARDGVVFERAISQVPPLSLLAPIPFRTVSRILPVSR